MVDVTGAQRGDIDGAAELQQVGMVVAWRGSAVGEYELGIVQKIGKTQVEGQYLRPTTSGEHTGDKGWCYCVYAKTRKPWKFKILTRGKRYEDVLLAGDVVATEIEWLVADQDETTTTFVDGRVLSQKEHDHLSSLTS